MLPGHLKESFLSAIRRLMRPIVRQLLAYGVSYPAFSQLLREIYVDVADRELTLPYKRQTDSRIALVTGVHRKETSRLRRQPGRERGGRRLEESAVTRVIGRWMAGPPYADARGQPRPLPYESSVRSRASFARLVRELAVDVPPRSVLDELLRVGAAELRAGNQVVLRTEANIPAQDAEAKLELLGSDPGELFSTIMHNVENPETPRLQRKVVYDNVGADALTALREAARRIGEQFIREANALLAAHDRDRNPQAPGGARTRVVLGAYYFEDEIEPRSDSASDRATQPPPASRPPRLPGRLKRS